MTFQYKTRAEQKLEHLSSLKRPLSDEESQDLRRSMHAVYCRRRMLAKHRFEELQLLKKLEREAQMPSDLA
jgi:hypothetical protein